MPKSWGYVWGLSRGSSGVNTTSALAGKRLPVPAIGGASGAFGIPLAHSGTPGPLHNRRQLAIADFCSRQSGPERGLGVDEPLQDARCRCRWGSWSVQNPRRRSSHRPCTPRSTTTRKNLCAGSTDIACRGLSNPGSSRLPPSDPTAIPQRDRHHPTVDRKTHHF